MVGNTDPNARGDHKVGRVMARAEQAAGLPLDRAADELMDICRAHEGGGPRGPLDDTCVHLESYGTRSSFLLALSGNDGNDDGERFLYAEGAPCETEYSDFTALLSELTQRARYGAGEEHARTLR